MRRRLLLSLLALVLVCISIVIGFSWVGYLQLPCNFVSPTPTVMDASWVSTVNGMIDDYTPCPDDDPEVFMAYCRLYIAENGTQNLLYYGNPDALGNYLADIIDNLRLQKQADVSEEFLDKVLATNKVAIIDYRVSILRMMSPSEKFYMGFFILEDNLNAGLCGTVIVREVETNGLGLWAVSK